MGTGEVIGVDENGQSTSEVTVVVAPDGSLITAFPGRAEAHE